MQQTQQTNKKLVTATYAIAKNEKNNIENFLYYAKDCNFIVILDTGSTDGTFEALQELANVNPKLIIKQIIYDEFRFDVAKNDALSLVPEEVDFCLAPDMDEHFSINTLPYLEYLNSIKYFDNLTCDRLDINSYNVRLGPSKNHPAFNKIHRRNCYTWKHPVYEYLDFTPNYRKEILEYSSEIFLIHNQKEKPREDLYVKLMKKEAELNKNNTWNLFYYLYYLNNVNTKSSNLEFNKYIKFYLENEKLKDKKYNLLYDVAKQKGFI